MVLDPESAADLARQRPTLLEQAERQGKASVTLAVPDTRTVEAGGSLEVTKRQGWGEWLLRISGAATWKRDQKPSAKGELSFGARWLKK